MKVLEEEDTAFALTLLPTILKNTDTSQNNKLYSPLFSICPCGHTLLLGTILTFFLFQQIIVDKATQWHTIQRPQITMAK